MKNFLSFCVLIFLSGCISVSVSGPKGERAKNIKFQTPSKPFEPLKSDQIDSAWKSSNTGNTISFLTDCGSGDDPSLESLKDSVTRGLDNREYESSEYFSYNGRRALRVVARGTLDGVGSKTQIVLLKKNECLFILTYGATSAQYASEASAFQQFVDRFEVP